MARIRFTFEEKGLEPKEVEIKVGDTVLDACEDNDIHLNHNCGEVCACSTCHVYVNTHEDHFKEMSDEEENFVDRAINPRIESRLGCQCVLEEDTNEVIEVEIPDQTKIIGHEH